MIRQSSPFVLNISAYLVTLALLLGACNMPYNSVFSATPTTIFNFPTQTVQGESTPTVASTPFDTSTPSPFPSASPSATNTPLIAATGAPTLTAAPVSGGSACNKAQFVRDETIPDGTVFSPGATFVKTWRLKNVGTCTWTPGYLLVFAHGQSMGPSGRAPDPVVLPTVAPGRTVDLSISLIAPPAPGHYQADFYLRSPSGANFGVGPAGRGTFWVKIVVLPPTATNTVVSYP